MTAARLAEAQAALMLLTRLPAGRVRKPVPTPSQSGWAFPLVGVLVGLAGWFGHAAALACGLSPIVAAVIAVAVAVAVTGGLHEDGVADFADGAGGGHDVRHRLEIMRDSRVGSYGAMALILALLLRVHAIADVGTAAVLAAFIAAAAVSRCAILVALALMPPARSDGLGHGAGRPSPRRMGAALLLTAAALVPLGAGALAVALAAAVAGAAVGLIAVRRLGGQTGDVLGAIQVVSETAAWLALAALTP